MLYDWTDIIRWELGCRRLTPGLPYLKAVQESNVHIERCPITRITTKGIETADGVLHAVDAIVCATGFNTSFSARYNIIGREAKDLGHLWKKQAPEAYMGLAVSGFPNYFGDSLDPLSYPCVMLTCVAAVLGPNCPIANGSLIPCIEQRYLRNSLLNLSATYLTAV
jgi:hypothetical protein